LPSSSGLVLQQFLVEPFNKRKFNAFYVITYQFTLGYLRFLKSRGYRFPVDGRTDRDPISDLGVDVLGSPLASKRERPFYKILTYFHTIGIDDSASHDPSDLWDKFTIWLRKQIKQELSRLGAERDAQIGNLKRRFNDILEPPEYYRFKSQDGHTGQIALVANPASLRTDLAPVSVSVLRDIAERAFLKSLNRSQWCREIFRMLSGLTDYQNFLKIHELISVVIAVNAEYVEIGALPNSSAPSPKRDLIRKVVEETRLATMSYIEKDVLPGYVGKGTISTDEAARLLLACDSYMLDWCTMGETDLKPVYFRQYMPIGTHGQVYLEKYKYVFETMLCMAVDNFGNRAKNNPIIRGFGDYLFYE